MRRHRDEIGWQVEARRQGLAAAREAAETGAVVAVTVQDANDGDTTTSGRDLD